jgi:hypothetical protein
MRDVCYKTGHLTVDQKKSLCRRAVEKSYNWHAYKLEQNSPHREYVNLSIEDLLTFLTESTHFVVVDRYTYDEHYLLIAFATMDASPLYSVFIYLKPEHISDLTDGLPIHSA